MLLFEALEKVFLLEIVKHILGFWVKLLFSWKVAPFLLPFGKTCIYRKIKFVIVLEIFGVSCVNFNEMFSVHYGKCILPTYPEWNIRQVWKFNILWASSMAKFTVLLNARNREICFRYLLRNFPSVLHEKLYFMFLVYLNVYKRCIWSSIWTVYLMYNQLNWKKIQKYIRSMLDTLINVLQILA